MITNNVQMGQTLVLVDNFRISVKTGGSTYFFAHPVVREYLFAAQNGRRVTIRNATSQVMDQRANFHNGLPANLVFTVASAVENAIMINALTAAAYTGREE